MYDGISCNIWMTQFLFFWISYWQINDHVTTLPGDWMRSKTNSWRLWRTWHHVYCWVVCCRSQPEAGVLCLQEWQMRYLLPLSGYLSLLNPCPVKHRLTGKLWDCGLHWFGCCVSWGSQLSLGERRGTDRSPVHHRATQTQTTTHTHS